MIEKNNSAKEDGTDGTYTLNEALELTKSGKFHLLILLVSGFCLFGAVGETFGVSLILSAAECELDLTLADKGLINAAGFLGMVLSAYFWGFLSDTWGRYKVMRFCLMSSFFCTVISSFSVNAQMLIVLRFLAGFFISGNSSTSFAYLGEFQTDKKRSRAITCAAVLQAMGMVYIPLVAYAVVPNQWNLPIDFLGINYSAWRAFFILCSATNFVLSLFISFMPESPKFLLAKGNHDEALSVLTTVFHYNTNQRREDFPVKKLILEETIQSLASAKGAKEILSLMWEQTAPLFRKKFILETSKLIIIIFTLAGISAGVFMWIPYYFNDLLAFHQPDMTLCQTIAYSFQFKQNVSLTEAVTCVESVDTTSFLIIAMAGFFFAMMFVVISIIINKFEKTTMLLFIMICCAVTSIALVFTTNFYLIIIFLILTCCVGTAQAFVSAICVDTYPTQVRAMALCLILMFGRFGAMAFSNIAGAMLAEHCDDSFYLICGLLVASTSLFIVPLVKICRRKNSKDIKN